MKSLLNLLLIYFTSFSFSAFADSLIGCPVPVLVVQGQFASIAPSGGVPPFLFSMKQGGGTVISHSGRYKAPATPGSAEVLVKDAAGHSSVCVIQINPPLALKSTEGSVPIQKSMGFIASGGIPPYLFSIAAGKGQIDSAIGLFTASDAPGSVTVKVTDSKNKSASASVAVYTPLIACPIPVLMIQGQFVSIAPSGGVPPFLFSMKQGGGTVIANSGRYKAPATPGNAEVLVKDAAGNSSVCEIHINPPLALKSPEGSVPIQKSMGFIASGGIPPYLFSIAAGKGQVDSVTGLFTASDAPGSVTVKVTDSKNKSASASVTVYTPLIACPIPVLMLQGQFASIAPSGGVPPFLFSMKQGGGTVIANSGRYKAPAAPGSSEVLVKDAAGNSSVCIIQINGPLSLMTPVTDLATDKSIGFVPNGGIPPYLFSIASGKGQIHSSSGLFTASDSPGYVTVKVTDSKRKSATATLYVFSPLTPALMACPTPAIVLQGNFITLATSGGVPPYLYIMQYGGGSVGLNNGRYKAPNTPGAAGVLVRDSRQNTSLCDIQINGPIALKAPVTNLAIHKSVEFYPSGGMPPYLFSISSGMGQIDPNSGVFTASDKPGTVSITVQDSKKKSATANLFVYTPETLDLSFGGGDGLIYIDLESERDEINASINQDDGKIISLGSTYVGEDQDMAILRILPTGALDFSFGVEGEVLMDFDSLNETAKGGLHQSDGKLVVIGFSGEKIVLFRLNADGSLDENFGESGKSLLALAAPSKVAAISSHPSGSIVALTSSELLIFHSNGILNQRFSLDDFNASQLTVQRDGKIVIAGSYNGKPTLIRFLSDFQPDPLFNFSGELPANGFINSLKQDGDAHLFLSGDDEGSFWIARINNNGQMDGSFGTGGVTKVSISPEKAISHSMTLEKSGKILVYGKGLQESQFTSTAACFTPNGKLDLSFGQAGLLTNILGSSDGNGLIHIFSPGGETFTTVGYSTDLSDTDILITRLWR